MTFEQMLMFFRIFMHFVSKQHTAAGGTFHLCYFALRIYCADRLKMKFIEIFSSLLLQLISRAYQ